MKALITTKPSVLLTLLCLSFSLPVFAQTTPPKTDAQFWNETNVFAPINKKLDALVIGILRIGQDMGRPVDERIGAGISYRPNRYLTLQPHYIYVAQQPFPGRKVIDHRLNLEATVRVYPGKFTVSDRNRLERRIRAGSPDFWVYRNRIQIDYPVKIGNFKFKPYVADEFWYDSSAKQWTRNRISVGIIKDLNKHLTGELFYLRQNDGRARPGNLHVLGTILRYRL